MRAPGHDRTMTYDLYIGDRTHSSWSLRGWLMFEKFGLPVTTHLVGLYTGTLAEDLAPVAPARLVPAMKTPEGIAVGDTMAMAETLAERHPGAGLWPADPAARARARWLAAEMHSGFTALRDACPMKLDRAVAWDDPTPDVAADVARIEALWTLALEAAGGDWLCGDYSLADVFFAPVAARIAGYGLAVGPRAAAYVARHLADPAFRRWRAMGLARPLGFDPYPSDLPERPWPGPAPRAARPVAGTDTLNDACPYSGRPVTHALELDGNRWGFCTAFCRDKTAADPDAWPAFAEIEARLR